MLLDLSGVGKAFGGLSALSDVSFSVADGDVFGLIGPNGAGKTTLFNIVTAMAPPTAGRVLFRGEEIGGLKPHDVTQRGIGRTFQNIRLFPTMTVAENVTVGRHCRTGAGVFRSVARTGRQRDEERAEIQRLAATDLKAYLKAMKDWGMAREERFSREGWRKMGGGLKAA